MTALVTGASAGIGLEFCRVLAGEGQNLVLVSRNQERLTSVKQEIESQFPGITCEVLPADLSVTHDVERVAQRIASTEHPVDVLINNAGFGLNQRFSTGDVALQQYKIDVLISAVMRLTHAAIGAMSSRGKGDVVIVSSVASFIAGGTYSAAKAWNTVFAEGLAQELRGSGVRVSALCPGFTHTEFHQRAGINKNEVPSWMWLDVSAMVRAGWRDHQRGKIVSIPGWQYKMLTFIIAMMPRALVRKVGYSARNRSRK